MSDRIRLLLDKVTARHMLTGLLKLAEARGLTDPPEDMDSVLNLLSPS